MRTTGTNSAMISFRRLHWIDYWNLNCFPNWEIRKKNKLSGSYLPLLLSWQSNAMFLFILDIVENDRFSRVSPTVSCCALEKSSSGWFLSCCSWFSEGFFFYYWSAGFWCPWLTSLNCDMWPGNVLWWVWPYFERAKISRDYNMNK